MTPRARWTPLALLLLIGCGEIPSAPTYLVAYTLSGTFRITFDSLVYENAAGTLVKVVAPDSGWGAALSAPSGSYVQARAWAQATQGGERAVLTARWTISGVSTAADSSFTTTSAPGAFTLTVVRRTIP